MITIAGILIGFFTVYSILGLMLRKKPKYIIHERTKHDRDLFVTIEYSNWYRPLKIIKRTALHKGYCRKNTQLWYWVDTGKIFTSKCLMNLVEVAEAEDRRFKHLTSSRKPDDKWTQTN